MPLTDAVFFAVVALGAIAVLRMACRWKRTLDETRVHTTDPALFRKTATETREIRLASLQGPSAKGFDARQGDRRMQVGEMKRRSR